MLPTPGAPQPGVGFAPGAAKPSEAAGRTAPPERPEALGVVAGAAPQAILAHRGQVVVARVGERTPWGLVVEVREGAAVLRTPDGKTVVIRVHLEGVK
jgi:hypothetical protein